MASRLADARDGGVELAASEREERLAELVVALADENANLRRALDTRVVIEQAKGELGELALREIPRVALRLDLVGDAGEEPPVAGSGEARACLLAELREGAIVRLGHRRFHRISAMTIASADDYRSAGIRSSKLT